MTSLTARLYALIAVLLGVGLLVAGILLDRDSHRITTTLLEAEGRRELDLLREAAPAGAIATRDAPAVDAWCDRMGALLDRRIAVIDPTGVVLGDSRVPLDSIPTLQNHADRPEVLAALRSGIGESTRSSWTIRRQLFDMAEPFPLAGADSTAADSAGVAVLRISIPVSSAYSFAHRWQGHLWVAVAAVFILVLAGGYLLGRPADRRLRTLRESAEALGRGDLTGRVPVESHDELAALARILNTMAERLTTQLAEIKTERDTSAAVLANLGQGVALIADDGTILHANARFWDVVGADRPNDPAPRLAVARQPALEEIVRFAMRKRAPVRQEASFYVGGRGSYEIAVSPVPNGAGSNHWLLSIEDLKPERAMAGLRREFVANVSHELKTPLTSIRGYAETLLHGGLDDEENRARFVETIRVQAVRLESLVEGLLELADLERPDAALDLKDWDMAEVVRDLAAGFEEMASRRGLTIDLTARPGFHARIDRTRIEVALRNLLENAIKYTESGSVGVEVRASNGSIRVSVSDTGQGIAPEHLPRIFERFYRADAGRARPFGGTGLGLSIVKHAIELHAGEVGVESVVGQGSTFWFQVPVRGPDSP